MFFVKVPLFIAYLSYIKPTKLSQFSYSSGKNFIQIELDKALVLTFLL